MDKGGERMLRDSQQDSSCLEQIEELREKMIATALLHGMNHPKVLWYSQQIDEKHNCILRKIKKAIHHN